MEQAAERQQKIDSGRRRRWRPLVVALVTLAVILLAIAAGWAWLWSKAVAAAEGERQRVRGDFAPDAAAYVSVGIAFGERQAQAAAKLSQLGFAPVGDPGSPSRAVTFTRKYGEPLPVPKLTGEPSFGAWETVSVYFDEQGRAIAVWLRGSSWSRRQQFSVAVELESGRTGTFEEIVMK